VSVAIRGLGIAGAFGLATALALAVQGVAIALSRREQLVSAEAVS
jgi:1-deoxy-D-xylulose 5-phosphate reductoisomerase